MIEKLIIFKHCDWSRAFILEEDIDKNILYKIMETRSNYPILEEHKVLDVDINLLNHIEDNLTEDICKLYSELICNGIFKFDFKELYFEIKERYSKLMEV